MFVVEMNEGFVGIAAIPIVIPITVKRGVTFFEMKSSSLEDDDFADEALLLHDAVAIHDMIDHCQLKQSIQVPTSCSAFQLLFKRSQDLTASEKKQIMDIFVQNMEELYTQSDWGWDLSAKQKELFHFTSRFLFLIDQSTQIVGYVMFRFEWDDEEEPEHPVLFVYELQVTSTAQHLGIGSYLMQLVEKISTDCRMWKVMLTCFKQNLSAMQFYLQKLKYGIDVNSPSRCGYLDESYEIISNKPNLK